MMQRAFELGYRRYEWKCDALNGPSRKAAKRLGFQVEGVFRQATIYKGRNRDTAWYSVIDSEWPELEGAFEKWLRPENFDEEGRQKISLRKLSSWQHFCCATKMLHYGSVVSSGGVMKIRIGSPVSGEYFYPRQKIINRLNKTLEGDNISFLAPRRTGKTSILFHLRDHCPEDNPHFFVNLETCTTPLQMIASLLVPFIKPTTKWGNALGSLKSGATSIIDRIESLSIVGNGISIKSGPQDWHKPAEQLLKLLESHECSLTYLLDEFPIFINSAARQDRDQCEALLRWFRVWRQQTVNSSIRFLVTGSIGLDSVVRRHKLADTVNDFRTVELPPLGESEALELLSALSSEISLSLPEPSAKHLLARLGNAYPYFVQIFVDELDNALPQAEKRLVTPELIDQIYRERVVISTGNEYLKHMWTRLKEALPDREYTAALTILKAIAHSERGFSRTQIEECVRATIPETAPLTEDELESILNLLKYDGYFQQDTEAPFRTRYFSNLLRDNCLRRYA